MRILLIVALTYFCGVNSYSQVNKDESAIKSDRMTLLDNAFEMKMKISDARAFNQSIVDKGGLDSTDSSALLGIGTNGNSVKRTILEFRDKMNIVPDFVFEFTFRFSLAPLIVLNKTKNEVYEQVDHKAEAEKHKVIQQMGEVVTRKVAAALNADPRFNAAPKEIQHQIRTKATSDAMTLLNQQVNAVTQARVNEAKQKMDDRIDDLLKETLFQEFAVAFSKVIGDGRGLIYFKGGKFTVETGPATDINNQTDLDKILASKSLIQHKVASTLAASIGEVYKYDEETTIAADILVYHKRMPFISGKNFVGSVIQLSEKDYNNHMDWYKIDSALLRVLLTKNRTTTASIKVPFYQAYGSVGSANGKLTAQAGFTIHIDSENKIMFDASYDDSVLKLLNSGASVFWAHQWTKRVGSFVGLEHLRGVYRPLSHHQQYGNETNVVFGTFVDVVRSNDMPSIKDIISIMHFSEANLRLKVQGEYNVNGSATRKDDSLGYFTIVSGAQLEAVW